MTEQQKSSPSLTALSELAAIRDYIAEAQRQMKNGVMPDITALEQRTADLCRIIAESSSTVQQECAPELKDLAHKLDDCEKDMRIFFEKTIPEVDNQK
jgi:hypothetical protein